MGAGGAGRGLGTEDEGLTWHPESLSPAQRAVVGQLAPPLSERGFYLAGGTAVALHLGHRLSIDLDWFTDHALPDPLQLAAQLRSKGLAFETTQVAPGTLHGATGGVRISLLEYQYPLLRPVEDWTEGSCPVASADDLAAMKLSAIAQRGSRKDFVDLWALGSRHARLPEMLELYRRKYGVRDIAHLLYSLSFFDDADEEPMPQMLVEVDWETIKATIREWVGSSAPSA